MSKVIVERPRRGGGNSRLGREVSIDSDFHIAKEGMRVPHVRNWGGKELNENLAPLRRFLTSCVGRAWNDVYSEISEKLKSTNAVQQHVRDHIKDFVAVNVSYGRRGELLVNNRSCRSFEKSGYELYVDPADGVLKKSSGFSSYRSETLAYREKRRIEQLETACDFLDGMQARKANGIWYSVTVKKLPPRRKRTYTDVYGKQQYYYEGGSAFDVIQNKIVYDTWQYSSQPVNTYCVAKRQLNHTELKKYGLKND